MKRIDFLAAILVFMPLFGSPAMAQFRTVEADRADTAATFSVDSVGAYIAYPWTLERCIEYARENNLTVKSQEIAKKSSEEDLLESKAAYYPTLNFSTSGSASFQNTSTYNEYDEATGKTSFSGSIGLNSGMTLYKGGRIRNTIKKAEAGYKASGWDLEQSKFDIEAEVISDYLQILYDNESLNLKIQNEKLSSMEVERAKTMCEAGSISKADLAQLQSTNASDKYDIVSARNSLSAAKLNLKQLLQLGMDSSFEVEFPTISDKDVMTSIPDLKTVYENALGNLPSMKSAVLSVDAADLSVKIAKGAFLPTVSLSAGINTGAYSGTGVTFIDQLNNKLGESVGLSISVPILNGREYKTSYNKAVLSAGQARITEEQDRNQLLSTLESLRNDAVSARSQYLASTEQLDAQKISYEMVSEQFNAGLKNTVELITEKNSLLSAQSKQLQAKYQAVLSMKLLDMYMNLEQSKTE
ncbi:MAG: TolC family protein [Bacteroidales bacterium]|nr:TolC family protein [Bacteroidales bacterium]MCI2145968.1 TolC family protein [Bacteroidales bacterium]